MQRHPRREAVSKDIMVKRRGPMRNLIGIGRDWKTMCNRISIANSKQSRSAKAATSHLKCAKGIFLKQAHRFKTRDNLDDLCARLETHFKRHGIDAIAHRNNPNNQTKMVSVFTLCPPFTIESVKNLNKGLIHLCDAHDKQSEDNAIKSFVSSLGEDLQQQIQVK